MSDSQYTTNLTYPDLKIKAGDADATIFRKIGLMLQVLTGISNSSTFNPTQFTPTVVVATSNGTVPSGATQVTFTFQPGFTGSVAGQAYTASSSPVVISAPINGTLSAINYTVSAGSVQIVSLVG